MPPLIEQIAGRRVDEHHGAPRLIVDEDGWRLICSELAAGQCTLLGLWGDTVTVHMAVLDQSEAASCSS